MHLRETLKDGGRENMETRKQDPSGKIQKRSTRNVD